MEEEEIKQPEILGKIQMTQNVAPTITIYGKPGIGKTTLASKFPDPLFLLTENTGIAGLNSLPIADSYGHFHQNVRDLQKLHDKPFKTIVVDSVTRLDSLVCSHILDKDERETGKRPKSLGSAAGGFGKGYEAAALIHEYTLKMLQQFTQHGIAVVLIAHMDVKTRKSPDSGDYDIYDLQLNHKHSKNVYINFSDAVLFGKAKSYIEELDSGRSIIKGAGKTILTTGSNGTDLCAETKNRFNMPAEIDMTFEAIAKYVPFYNEQIDEDKRK